MFIKYCEVIINTDNVLDIRITENGHLYFEGSSQNRSYELRMDSLEICRRCLDYIFSANRLHIQCKSE